MSFAMRGLKEGQKAPVGSLKVQEEITAAASIFQQSPRLKGVSSATKTYQSSDPKCRCYNGMALAPGFLLRGQHVSHEKSLVGWII